jgi:hypothetical protein
MDWEKKTAMRPPLDGAAADTANALLTPGQSLLRSLQVPCAFLFLNAWHCLAISLPRRVVCLPIEEQIQGLTWFEQHGLSNMV